MNNSGTSIIVAALILGACVLASGFVVRSSLEQGSAELGAMRTALADLSEAVKEMPSAAPAPAPAQQAAARPNRPDPNKRYTVNTEGSPAIGPASAKVTLVEFSDFQCPFCSRVTPTMNQIKEEYGDQVRIVFKHLPLSIHPKAPAAHAAAEAAHRQGKFWEMHDKIFGNQQEMSPEKYAEYAAELELDIEKYNADLADESLTKRIDSDAQDAAALLVRGTPGFFINGKFLSGAQPFAAFKQQIDAELSEEG